jgi:hypothetical protein
VSKPLGGVLRSTDTVVQRHTGLQGDESGRIVAEIVALSLGTASPIDGTPFGLTGLFDVFVNLDNRTPSMGVVEIESHTAGPTGGGTFSSFFDVFSKITLTSVSTGNSQSMFRTDHITSGTFAGLPPGTWSHVCPTGDPGDLACRLEGVDFELPSGDPPFTSGGFFILIPPVHTGPHPRVVVTRAPEPVTLVLLGSGLAALGLRARRKKAKA